MLDKAKADIRTEQENAMKAMESRVAEIALDDFDEQLFSDLVEKIVVVDNEKLCFRLLNGLEVTEKIERTQR